MVTLEKNKANFIIGKLNSAKTTVILNTIKDYLEKNKDSSISLFSPDTPSHHVAKKLHCLINDVYLSTVKHDPKTKMPVALKLPEQLQIIDDCSDFDKIETEIASSNSQLIILDNINQIDFNLSFENYREKIEKTFKLLNELAISHKVTILASMYILEISNLHNEDEVSFKNSLGNVAVVSRNEGKVDIFDESSEETISYEIDPQQLKLVKK